jgi:hypothetical protein
MSDLVIDEWLWSDLIEANGKERRIQAFDFLEAIFNKCDRIVTVRGSAFHEKMGLLWKRADNATHNRVARYYRDKFAHNEDKTRLIEESELLELAPELAGDTPPSDRYLVRAQITTKADLLVTTDGPLMKALQKHGIPHQDRDKFVPDYISKHGTKI